MMAPPSDSTPAENDTKENDDAAESQAPDEAEPLSPPQSPTLTSSEEEKLDGAEKVDEQMDKELEKVII